MPDPDPDPEQEQEHKGSQMTQHPPFVNGGQVVLHGMTNSGAKYNGHRATIIAPSRGSNDSARWAVRLATMDKQITVRCENARPLTFLEAARSTRSLADKTSMSTLSKKMKGRFRCQTVDFLPYPQALAFYVVAMDAHMWGDELGARGWIEMVDGDGDMTEERFGKAHAAFEDELHVKWKRSKAEVSSALDKKMPLEQRRSEAFQRYFVALEVDPVAVSTEAASVATATATATPVSV